MGLLSTEVEITLAGTNVKWYEEKGYKLPRRYDKRGRLCLQKNSKLLVKIKDLPSKCNVMVDVECDYCKKNYFIRWSDYNIQLHDGKIYCKSCVHTVLHTGENHPNWNPKLTQEERINGRDYKEYEYFIKKVLMRDKYTCQFCYGHADVVHHLDGYDWCIEKRTDETNGIALCNSCHKNFHSIYGYGGNTKKQFEEWSNKKDIILKSYDGIIPSSRWAYCITDDEIIENIVPYAKEHDLDYSPIYRCCDGDYPIYRGKIYMWYDEYTTLSKEEFDEIIRERKRKRSNERKVVCVNYKLLFNSQVYGSKYFNIGKTGICQCCSGQKMSAGKTKDNKKLVWKYADDVEDIENYTLVSNEECNYVESLRKYESSNDGSFIMEKNK